MENYIGNDLLKKHDIETAENPFCYDGLVIGLPFNLKQLVERMGKEHIPKKLGIYHLFYNDQLVYIGMSKNLRGRLTCHLKDKDMPFNNVLWFTANNYKEDATISDILKIEYNMIKLFKPVLNSLHANCRQIYLFKKNIQPKSLENIGFIKKSKKKLKKLLTFVKKVLSLQNNL